MSLAGLNRVKQLLDDPSRFVGKHELMVDANKFLNMLGWRFWLKTEIVIPWPNGWTPQDHLGNSAQSSDPNDWYREWLESNVGRQGWSWDWRYTVNSIDVDTLVLRFRRPEHATAFALKWA